MPGARSDHLTAPDSAIAAGRRNGPRTLGDCWRSFTTRPSPRLLLPAVLVALAARVAVGVAQWSDLVMAAGLVGVTPLVEWAIHVGLLHAQPMRIGRRRIDLITAREHRAHHAAPAELDGVLVPPLAVATFLVMIAVVVLAAAALLAAVLGGGALRPWLTGTATAWAILTAYEWTHFLIHAPYRPRRRYFGAIRRNHRLHHYKNERYWFGVTSTLGDQLARTRPDHSEVPTSMTARRLPGDG